MNTRLNVWLSNERVELLGIATESVSVQLRDDPDCKTPSCWISEIQSSHKSVSIWLQPARALRTITAQHASTVHHTSP